MALAGWGAGARALGCAVGLLLSGASLFAFVLGGEIEAARRIEMRPVPCDGMHLGAQGTAPLQPVDEQELVERPGVFLVCD